MQNGPSQGPREAALPNANTTIVRSPLHEAAATGNHQQLEQILATGADRNHKDSKHGNTPLHEAAWRGYSKCVKALCALPKISKEAAAKSKQIKNAIAQTHGSLHSALLGTRNIGGFSALHLAAQNGHNQSCREILLAGGDPNVQNNYGDTPLHTACRYGHAGATRILLSAKADPLRVNLNGDSALHIACAMGRRKLTRILLAAGSSLKILNAQNEVARDIAVRKKLPEILEILDAPVDEIQRDRDRSSSSSHKKEQRTEPAKGKDGPAKTPKTSKYDVNPKNWSPYGCHYFPDPRSFPSPRLETLPKEPLGTGEQYFLDLAGNIRKGPVGVGNTCYCGPFFRHIEERITRNKKSLKKYVHKATEKLDSKVQALALKTDDQIEQITRKMLADRIRCDGQRQHLEQWLKRGDRTRATVAPHTSKSHKDQTNTNTLTRCRSLEMLDHNGFVESMKCTTPGISRSFDLLDTHQVIVHRDADNSDEHDDSDGRNQSYLMDSDKEWQYHGSSKPASSDKDKFSSVSGDKQRLSSSEKDRNSLDCKSDETDVSKRVKYVERQKGYSVAARLEELLSKTNEIIEMERTARRKSNEAFSMLAPEKEKAMRRSNKQSTGSDLRVSSSSRSSGITYESSLVKQFRQSAFMCNPEFKDDIDDRNEAADNASFTIAHEMEKITSSLLGHNDTEQRIQGSSTDNGPVSPEIAKEYSSQKEQLAAREQEQELSSVLSEGSHRSYGMSDYPSRHRNGSNYHVVEVTTSRPDLNGYMSASENSPASGQNSENVSAGSQGLTPAVQSSNVLSTFGGFYQNTGFNDEAATTTSGKAMDSARRSAYHHDGSGSLDVDDRCELSEMANMKELNELKSRILNGAHWRSQLRKNGSERESSLESGAAEPMHVTAKIEAEENDGGDTCTAPMLPIRSKVHDLVAKIQGSKNITNSEAPSYTVRNNTAAVDDEEEEDDDEASESSDEDEDDDIDFSHDVVDTVDRFSHRDPTAATIVPLKSAEFLYDAFRSQRQLPPAVNPKPIEFKAYTMNGEDSSVVTPQFTVSQPKPSNAQPSSVIDTRYLIPKDAYFHELPNRNRPSPITDKLPEIAFPPMLHNGFTHSIDQRASVGHASQPFYQPNYMGNHQQSLSMHPADYQQPSASAQYFQHITQLPQREKLLSNRKFSVTATAAAAHLKPAYALPGVAAPPLTMPSMSTHFINIEQEQIERDANNDSGYSTRINGSLNGPSPSLSGQTDPDVNGMDSMLARNNVYRGGTTTSTVPPPMASSKYDRYYMSNIGASSLV